MILQKLKKGINSKIDLAKIYYSILSAFNSLELTDREIELMSYIAVHGTISISENRKSFCEKYNTTSATVNNMVSKLKKKNLLVKKDGKIFINGIISLDFSKNIHLELKFEHAGKVE
jgi:DNA-binding MarR family transcriptional regulator